MTKYTLTDEHRAQLAAHHAKWVNVPMRTEALSAEERECAIAGIRGMYAAAKLPAPKHVAIVGSPFTAAIAATIAASYWWLLEHQDRHAAMFGRHVPTAELRAAALRAAQIAGQAGLARLHGLRVEPAQALRSDAATDDATRAATYAATSAATSAATRDATYAATYDATDAATRDATSAATDDATYDAPIRLFLGCCYYAYRGRNAGNQWAGWVEFIEFFRTVVRLQLDWTAWAPYADAAIAGPRHMFASVCLASDMPSKIAIDERRRPHCADGPSHVWRDGWTLYHWHGVRVPRRLIEAPDSYTPAEIIAIENSEIVRALAERIGWEAFLAKLGATPVDEWTDPATGLSYALLSCSSRFADEQPRFLRMLSPRLKDGTQPTYLEPVHPELTSARAARRWQVRGADGDWPSVKDCNDDPTVHYAAEDGIVVGGSGVLRQGDIVLHATGEQPEANAPVIPGASLAQGAATGHSHAIVPASAAQQYELHDGMRLLVLSEDAELVHDEHETVHLPAGSYRVSHKRQYDAEHGWAYVRD